MKRFIFLAVLLNMVFLAQGQGNGPDTITRLMDDYFYDFFPPEENLLDTSRNSHQFLFVKELFWGLNDSAFYAARDSAGLDSNGYVLDAVYLLEKRYTPHPLHVIGMAAVTELRTSSDSPFYGDSLYFQDSVLLFEVDDSGGLIRRWAGYCNPYDTIRHSLKLNVTQNDYCWEDHIYGEVNYPIYEIYSDTAILVEDSFYIGATCYNSTSYAQYLYGHDLADGAKQFFYYFKPYPIAYPAECNVWKEKIHWRFISRGFTAHWQCDAYATMLMWPIVDLNWVDAEHPEQSEGAKVYPNPAGDRVTVESEEEIVRVWVTDELGRMVYDHDHHSPKVYLNVAPWPNGMYVVHFQTATAPIIYTSKLMVTH